MDATRQPVEIVVPLHNDDVGSFVDVDVSTNLTSFLPRVAPLLSGHSEVAIGTRLAHSSHVRRRVKREVFSSGKVRLQGVSPRCGATP